MAYVKKEYNKRMNSVSIYISNADHWYEDDHVEIGIQFYTSISGISSYLVTANIGKGLNGSCEFKLAQATYNKNGVFINGSEDSRRLRIPWKEICLYTINTYGVSIDDCVLSGIKDVVWGISRV